MGQYSCGNAGSFFLFSAAFKASLTSGHRFMKTSIENQHKEEYKETTVLVAEINGRIEAYTVAWLVGDELQVIDLAVDRAWRRHGLGKLLMERLIKMWYAQLCPVSCVSQ